MQLKHDLNKENTLSLNRISIATKGPQKGVLHFEEKSLSKKQDAKYKSATVTSRQDGLAPRLSCLNL